MPVAINRPFTSRTPRPEIDRRAIGVFGHLLMAGVWLECQFKHAPQLRANQPRNEEA
jgi:hypothetical protein